MPVIIRRVLTHTGKWYFHLCSGVKYGESSRLFLIKMCEIIESMTKGMQAHIKAGIGDAWLRPAT